MRRSTVSRIAAASAVFSLVVGGLSGCFLLPPAPDGNGPVPTHESTEDPERVDGAIAAEVGDCWEATYANLAEWVTWEDDTRVDCDEPHQSYTFVAQQYLGLVDDAYDEDGYLTDELALDVSHLCLAILEDDLGWDIQQQRLNLYFFIPTEKDWRDGDRSIRCDLAIKAIGSEFFNPDLEDLATNIEDLKHELRSNGDAYQLCLIGDGFGPLEGEDSTIADCTRGNYFWRLGGVLDYPAGETDPYPPGDTLFNYAIDECPSLGIEHGESVYPYQPSPDSWAAGDRSIECWFSTLEVPSSAV